jgi:co-chaperonin GroES (HSP10)
MQAINKYIIIEKIAEEMKTESGLLLSGEDANEFRYNKGRVVNPGTNVATVKEGDLIYYDKSSGHSMVIQDRQYTIILERDVVVVL